MEKIKKKWLVQNVYRFLLVLVFLAVVFGGLWAYGAFSEPSIVRARIVEIIPVSTSLQSRGFVVEYDDGSRDMVKASKDEFIYYCDKEYINLSKKVSPVFGEVLITEVLMDKNNMSSDR